MRNVSVLPPKNAKEIELAPDGPRPAAFISPRADGIRTVRTRGSGGRLTRARRGDRAPLVAPQKDSGLAANAAPGQEMDIDERPRRYRRT